MGKQQERGKPTISKWDRIYNFYITSNSYGFRESSKSLQVHWSIIVFPMKVAIMARGSPSEWVKLDQLDPCEIETTLTIIQPKRWVRDHHLSIIYILTMVITGNIFLLKPMKYMLANLPRTKPWPSKQQCLIGCRKHHWFPVKFDR